MATGPVSVELDTRALRAFQKRLERYQGLPLQQRMERGALDAARLLVPHVRRATPKGPTGNLRKSIRAGASRSMRNGLLSRAMGGSGVRMILSASQGGMASAYVGPSSRVAPHRHLVIRGHRIVTPGGRDTGRSTTGNPFVDNAVQPRQAEALRVVRAAIFAER